MLPRIICYRCNEPVKVKWRFWWRLALVQLKFWFLMWGNVNPQSVHIECVPDNLRERWGLDSE